MDNDNTLPSPPSRPATWGQMGAYLLTADREQPWKAHAETVRKWFERVSAAWGVAAPTLWRYLGAAKYIEQRRPVIASRGLIVPPLEKVSATLSAEAIELLSKMGRVVPADVFDDIELRVFREDIKKKEVQAAWAAYAPLLQGKTARGRGTRVAPVVLDDSSRISSDLVLALRRSNGRWLQSRLAVFEVYSASDLEPAGTPGIVACDALIASRASGGRDVCLHGLSFAKAGRVLETRTSRWFGVTVDFCWIVSREELAEDEMRRVPARVGLLKIDLKGKVTVERQAKAIHRDRSPAEQLARLVLGQMRGR